MRAIVFVLFATAAMPCVAQTYRTVAVTHPATLEYTKAGVTTTGKAMITTGIYDSRFALRFSDSRGDTLVDVRDYGDTATIAGRLIPHSWSGRLKDAPADLRGWLSVRELFVRQVHTRVVRRRLGSESWKLFFL